MHILYEEYGNSLVPLASGTERELQAILAEAYKLLPNDAPLVEMGSIMHVSRRRITG